MAKDRNPQAQRLRDMYEAQDEARKTGTLIADFPNRAAFDQAMYNRAQEIAASRGTGAQSPLTGSLMAGKEKQEVGIPENVMTASNEAFRGLTNAPIPAFPSSANFGASGFSRSMPTSEGGQAIQLAGPYGFAQTSLNPQQVEQREQARQQAQQMGTMPRTPEQQQTLLAQMRELGSGIRQQIATTARDSFENRQPSRLYTTPSGSAIAAPTNMFGQPIADFQQRYAQREERMAGQRASSVAALGSTGFGAMQRQQASMTPPPIRTPSLFGGMGYASTLGGPQPATSVFATGPTTENRRRRIFGTV